MSEKTGSTGQIPGKKRRLGPQREHPEDYAGVIYLNARLFRGVRTVADAERMSIKATAEMLLEDAFSRYMWNLIKEKIRSRQAIREGKLDKRKVKDMRMARIKRRFLREGMRPKLVDML